MTDLAKPPEWRCFYCDEVFTDRKCAEEHFGSLTLHSMPISDPACGVSLERFREMEHDLARYRMEDSDKDREHYARQADHAQALIREGQKGYDKGVSDMRDELARAESSLSEALAREAAQWQPIETAPKDGTPVLLAANNDGRRFVGEAQFVEGEWWWANTAPTDYHGAPVDYRGTFIMAWMPLPTPPASLPLKGSNDHG